jgi:hypothetical protein
LSYQLDFAEIAHAALRRRIFSEDQLAEMDAGLSPEEQEYNALMDQASRQYDDIKTQLDAQGKRIDQHIEEIAKFEGRLKALEIRFVGEDFINKAQQHQYLRMVNLVAERSKKKGERLDQAMIHNMVKKEFVIPSYKFIGEDQFPDVVRWLAGLWRKVAPGEPLPEDFGVDQRRLF